MALDFSNGVFDFQKEIDMDLTHVTTSVALKERTLRHISWPNETEGVFPRKLPFKVARYNNSVATPSNF